MASLLLGMKRRREHRRAESDDSSPENDGSCGVAFSKRTGETDAAHGIETSDDDDVEMTRDLVKEQLNRTTYHRLRGIAAMGQGIPVARRKGNTVYVWPDSDEEVTSEADDIGDLSDNRMLSLPSSHQEARGAPEGAACIPITGRAGIVAYAWVDQADSAAALSQSWNMFSDGYPGNTKLGRLHRWVLGAPEGTFVDHIDGDKLNAMRSNLRFATRELNMQNRKKKAGTKSCYLGVTCERGASWVAKFRRTTVGHWATEEAAAWAYDEAVRAVHGELGRVNGVPRPDNLESLQRSRSTKSRLAQVASGRWRVRMSVGGVQRNVLCDSEVEAQRILQHLLEERKLIEVKKKQAFIKAQEQLICRVQRNEAGVPVITAFSGEQILVSEEDWPKLCVHKWRMIGGYAVTTISDKTVSMSRFLMNVKDEQTLVDHRDHNTANNQRKNLRLATAQENAHNKTSQKLGGGNTGVWRTESGLWRARIKCRRKYYGMGPFATQQEAVSAWNAQARASYGDFAIQQTLCA
jgi:hypothetical protein